MIKAALLAGGDRSAVSGYSVNTSSGLSNSWGAGELNIYNSYHILAGGEQDSNGVGRSANISRWGFDYDSSFSQSERFYRALKEKGVEVMSLLITGAGHGGPEFNTPEVAALITTFFDRHLKSPDGLL